MRRFLVVGAVVCSLLWAVTGVSVLAIVFHEHHHHHAENHNYDVAFELVLGCHDNGGSPHHDHELTAPPTVTGTQNSVHIQAVSAQSYDLDEADSVLVSRSNSGHTEARDAGPPAYLLHCVSLT